MPLLKASDSFPTRESTMDAINAAGSLSEIFETANAALELWRHEWGDGADESRLAKRMWDEHYFIAASAPVLHLGDGRQLFGSQLEHTGLAAAKLVARELLRPIPKNWASYPPQISAFGRRSKPEHPVLAAAEAILNGLDHLVCDLALHAVPGVPPGFARELDPTLLIGESAQLCLKYSVKVWLLERTLRPGTLHDDSTPNPPTEISAQPDSDPFFELVHRLGFELASCGPQGGWRRAQAQAINAVHAFDALGLLLALPSSGGVSLGGLGIKVNADSNSPSFFSSKSFSFCFRNESSDIGHEWTHALEFRFKRSAGTALAEPARQALCALEAGLLLGPRDDTLPALLVAQYESFQRQLLHQDLYDFLSISGHPELRDSSEATAATATRLVEELCMLAHDFVAPFSQAKQNWVWKKGDRGDPAGALKTWRSYQATVMDDVVFSSLHACCDPSLDDFTLKRAKILAESLRVSASGSCALITLLDSCSNAFVARSAFEELLQPNGGYWTLPSEMLARAAEGFFVDAGATPPLVIPSCSGIIPLGAECTRISALYRTWIQAAAPWLSSLAAARTTLETPWPVARSKPNRAIC